METINTFGNGMHSDNDPSMQPEGTYRDSQNGNIIAYGQNRFVWESVKGTKSSFTIPNYNQAGGYKHFTPIGWVPFKDYLLVFSANDQSASSKPGEIGKVTFDNDGDGTYTPLYHHYSLGFSIDHPIPHDGVIAKPETSSIARVVWTDNYNSMRSLNVLDPRLSTNIASGSLITGRKYMVISKAATSYVTHAATDYGAGYGNTVFTATGATYTETGTCDVIEYIPLEALAITPDFAPGNIEYIKRISGNLPAAQYQYFYQLETTEGTRTNWSYISQPVVILGPKSPTTQTQSYAEYIGYSPGTATSKGIRMKITNIDDQTYTKIRIGYIKSVSEGVYTDPDIIFYTDLTLGVSTFEFDHVGGETVLETLNINDITTPNVVMDLVKSIASTKNILFAANVASTPEPEIDLSDDVEMKSIEYLMPADVPNDGLYDLEITNSVGTIAGGYALFGHKRSEGNGANPTQYMPYQWYEVTSGSASDYVTYNGNNYYPGGANGAYFQVTPAIGYTISTTGSPTFVAVMRTQRYTGTYHYHRVENDFLDHKGMSGTFYRKSYWRGETYRFGIIFYGKKGQPSFVQWLGDKTMPKQYKYSADTEVIKKSGTTATIGFDCRLGELYSASSREAFNLRALGIDFSNINFNTVAAAYGVAIADLGTVMKGFSIVRMQRDAQVQHQGVIWPTVVGSASTNYINPLSTKAFLTDNNFLTNGRKINFYCYYSPDTLANYPTAPTIQAGDYFEIADFYGALTCGAGATAVVDYDGIAIGDRVNLYEKYYNTTSSAAGSTIYTKGGLSYINDGITNSIERGATSVLLQNGNYFYNECQTHAIHTIGSRHAYGCDTLLVCTTTAESGGTANGIGNTIANPAKRTIVTWIRPKSNLYGGNDDATKATHLYIPTGHYQAMDSGFIAHLQSTSGGKGVGYADNIEVWGGDCYVSLFGQGIQMDATNLASQYAFGMVIPIESNINENWRGRNNTTQRTFNANRFYDATNAPDGINAVFPSLPGNGQEESNVFDKVYTLKDKQQLLPARPLDFSTNNREEHTVYYSLEKVDGEILDNWKIFKVNNYKQVDGQFGAINNIRAKSSRLFYWQDRGVGIMPVFEKVMQNSLLGENIQLGVGGILDRFDEIDYFHGNQHQMSLMEGEDAFMWFDFRNREVMRLGYEGQRNSLSVVKGLDSYFQTIFEQFESETGSTIFNSDNPMNGYGILSYYDPRFKLGLMTFKINKTVGVTRSYEADFTIAFNRHLDKYIGFMSFTPSHMVHFNNYLLMSKVVRYNIQNSSAYSVGDQVQDTGTYDNYVCIVAYTSANPAVQPSSDPTHWAIMNQKRNVHVAWRNDICKFFGVVYPASITYVAKSPDLNNICVDNVEVAGNDTRLTDVYIENRNESASDTTIRTTNRNFRYFDGSWWFSLPLTTKRIRLADHYLQIKLQIKNYTGTSITSSLNTVKRILYVKNFLRRKL